LIPNGCPWIMRIKCGPPPVAIRLAPAPGPLSRGRASNLFRPTASEARRNSLPEYRERPMLPTMKRLAFPLLLCLVSFPALATDEEKIVASFKELAQTESSRLADSWLKFSTESLDKSVGVHLLFSKYMFRTIKIESAPPTYDIDVKRTDSLIDPYLAYIEFPLVFLRSVQFAKGPSESCNGKSLDDCLKEGGEIYESATMYKPITQRFPQIFVYEYTYQGALWVPKTNFEAAFGPSLPLST